MYKVLQFVFPAFFQESCNSTVWTIGYVVPYHAECLYEEFKVGYGIISMQGKEAKNSAIKHELKIGTNRSVAENDNGKWHQIMRSSYIRNVYLAYHFPISNYHSHYQSRLPINDSVPGM